MQGGCWTGVPSDSPSAPPEYKRARHEIKKKSSDTLKLQKKARKGERGSPGGCPHQPLRSTPSQGRYPGCGTANRGWALGGSCCPPVEREVPARPGDGGEAGHAPQPSASFHTFSLSPSLFPPLHILPVELLGK